MRKTSLISLFSLSRHRILHSHCRFFNSSSEPSSNKLFVGGIYHGQLMKNPSKILSLHLEMSLKVFFHFSLPCVRRYRIVYDKDSGRARGFGFVIFSNEDDAKSAKDAMDRKVGY
ncbi:hypothetical protein P8452_26513 [Trifolium repens]|nr:hypothetical protein P8452_26513 [Trifolium repens]